MVFIGDWYCLRSCDIPGLSTSREDDYFNLLVNAPIDKYYLKNVKNKRTFEEYQESKSIKDSVSFR